MLHPHGVILQLLFHNGDIGAVQMDHHLPAGDVAKTDNGIADGARKMAGTALINWLRRALSMLCHAPCASSWPHKCVPPLHHLHVSEIWWGHTYNATNDVGDVAFLADSERKETMDAISSCGEN
jgi:hypothetical protein